MSNVLKPKKKNNYYTYQLERDEDDSVYDETATVSTNISAVRNVQEYAQQVGSHVDPSRYDVLRHNGNKKKNSTNGASPVFTSQQTQVNDDQFYDTLVTINSDDYTGETVIDELIIPDNTLYCDDVERSQQNTPSNPSPSISNQHVDTYKENEETVTEEVPCFENHSHVVQGKYVPPDISLLPSGKGQSEQDVALAEKQKEIIERILRENKVEAHVSGYIFGPTVIVYFVEYEKLNIPVKTIQKFESNFMSYLEVKHIRILTPVPGKSYSGIEVPRPADSREFVYFRDVIESPQFKNSKMELPIVVGKTNYNENIILDVNDLPHAIAGGQTKSGKSVSLNVMIMSLIFDNTPDDVRIILLDPKRTEFIKYNSTPHLAMPVITEEEYFEPCLEWLVNEMERRYKLLGKYGTVDLKETNEYLLEKGEKKIPYIVFVMDEFNDWFATASSNLEAMLTKLLQKARAAGISMIFATQHPSSDVIKGSIKANIPARFTFAVGDFSSSNIMLGQGGAEKLEGYGDMILRAPCITDTRLQGAFASNKDIRRVMDQLRECNEENYIITLEELKQSSTQRGPGNGSSDPKLGRNDELFVEVARYVVANQNASVNKLTKIYSTGFNRMDSIFNDLANLGIVSSSVQGTARKVLVNEVELESIIKENGLE